MRDGLLEPSTPSTSAASGLTKDRMGILPLSLVQEMDREGLGIVLGGLDLQSLGHRWSRDGSLFPGSIQVLPVGAELLVVFWISSLFGRPEEVGGNLLSV